MGRVLRGWYRDSNKPHRRGRSGLREEGWGDEAAKDRGGERAKTEGRRVHNGGFSLRMGGFASEIR